MASANNTHRNISELADNLEQVREELFKVQRSLEKMEAHHTEDHAQYDKCRKRIREIWILLGTYVPKVR